MIVVPAIDLMDGTAVRLAEGQRERVTTYSDDPQRLAEDFARAGAKRIHVVDLDGAFAGRTTQVELIERLVATAHPHGAAVQVGGGIRDCAAVERLRELGVDYVVVGTLAVRDPDTVAELCHRHPGRMIVAVDAKDGRVAVDGWRSDGGLTARDLAHRAAGWGAEAVLYTDVARDGLQVGPAVEATARLQEDLPITVIASGGVGSLEDLDELRDAGIHMVVLGRALYEGSFTLEEALARC